MEKPWKILLNSAMLRPRQGVAGIVVGELCYSLSG
jgi:hypothetical protein